DVLEKDLDQHRRDQRKALSDRLRKRKAAQAEALQRAGAGAEETVAAMKALESDSEREAIQLEQTLATLETTQRTEAAKASAFATGED
ncbi:unnamed protein product, partial [Sphacelaria rigidula]